jgi:hypothetical protein
MARHYRKKHHSRGKTTLPLAIIVPVGMAAIDIGEKVMAKNYKGLNQYAGLNENGQFYVPSLLGAYAPFVSGFAIHWGASKIGINRALGRAKVPLIRI